MTNRDIALPRGNGRRSAGWWLLVMLVAGLATLSFPASAAAATPPVEYTLARVIEARHLVNSYHAHNVSRLLVLYEPERVATADFLGFFDATGGLERWGYPISEIFEEQPGVLVQYFENGVLEFRPDSGVQRRLVWDLLGGDIAESAIANKNEGSTVGPWERTVSNFSVDSDETGFLDAFERLGGVDSFGYPKTEARPDSHPEALVAVDDPPTGVVRQYFQAGVLEAYTHTTLTVTIRPVGTELRDRLYPDDEWIGLLAFRQTAPVETWASHPRGFLRHTAQPVLAIDRGVLVGRATHPYGIAYHSQRHLLQSESGGWYALTFDGDNGVVAYSPDGRSFEQRQVVTHLQTGFGMSMYEIDGRLYILYADSSKRQLFLRIGTPGPDGLSLGEPILVADMKASFMAYLSNLAIGPDGLPWIVIRSYKSTPEGSINHIWLTHAIDDSLDSWLEPTRLTTDEEGVRVGFGGSGSLAFAGDDLVVVFILIDELRAIVGDGDSLDELVTETLGSFLGTHDFIIIGDGDTSHLAYHAAHLQGQMMVYQSYTPATGWSDIEEVGPTGTHATAMTIDDSGNVWVFYGITNEIMFRVRPAGGGGFGPVGCAVRLDPLFLAGSPWLASAQPAGDQVGLLWTIRIADRWEVRFAALDFDTALAGAPCP
ncbi:MAG: hypothetical protein QF719_02745 [Chloroflexota bacterium]|nr:hypothetical protein [Chloroflexota bacterium]MDP6757121.1 hypothetical protein [Chloroflexota bacterium]